MRNEAEGNRWFSYRELAPRLAAYVNELGFTHIEFLPIMEHPYYASWGYQVTGYFAPSSRFGTPQDFMYLVDYLHQHNIGIILDWVPSHFPNDQHGLAYFDGTHLYEHADPRKGFHPDWKSAIFNYGRNEVRAFLISNAMFWLDKYHIDGLRMDAIASMLYLDYSRKQGEWIPNIYGGRENLEAVSLLRQVNTDAYGQFPDIQTIAEESTAWPMVSRPVYIGGLGFGMKWDMGWMHDTLKYFQQDPIHRKYHHNKLTFRGLYAFTENFTLPLSHDEVVHGKGSLIGKMSGDYWQKFANLRLLFGYMFTQPGKKLLFMGGEIGQWNEWNHDSSVDWLLLTFPSHQGIKRWVSDLNAFYRGEPAMHQLDFSPDGLRWIDANDNENSVLTYMRYGKDDDNPLVVALNFTPVPRRGYRIGVPKAGHWREVLNSNASLYGGTDEGNYGGADSEAIANHGFEQSLLINLPPLGMVVFKQ
jgi:1,4-alpha-glucan branching enzyme